jgi:hypothetical protein
MEGITLLEKYPFAAKVMKDWFLERMITSLNDESIDQDFKDYILKQGLENEKMAILIDANPRMLFDVFDENDIVIETLLYPSKEFTVIIGRQATTNSWKTRKESELFAIEAAFEILENKLSLKEEEIN